MKQTELLAVYAFGLAAALTFGLYWLLPMLPWWAYLIFGGVAAGSAYDQSLKMTANEKIIDRGDWPNKK